MFNNKISKVGVGLLLVLSVSGAQAAMMNFSTVGDVLYGQETASNIFGLSAGDTITANGVFDDSGLVAGTGTVIFDASNMNNSLMISVGSYTFTAADDLSYLTGGFPALSFTNYQLTDFNFLANEFSSWGPGFDDTYSLYGEWRAEVAMSPVPLPTAMLLLGSGLLGMAGFIRSKQ